MSSQLASAFREYAPGQDVPLTDYATLMGTFTVLLGGVLTSVAQRKRPASGWGDLLLLGVATHKLSRLLTKDAVTSPLRAPFSRRQATEGAGEVHDEPRGGVVRRGVGELLTCPYCAGPWLATGLGSALAWRPFETRFVLRLLSAVTLSDFLHMSYALLNESRKRVQAERRLGEGH